MKIWKNFRFIVINSGQFIRTSSQCREKMAMTFFVLEDGSEVVFLRSILLFQVSCWIVIDINNKPNSGILILEPAPGSTATPVVTAWAPGTIKKSRTVVCKHYISSNEFLSSFCMLENVNFLSGSTTLW